MAIEIHLVRSAKTVPWGFRIIGGVESRLPIIVSKVFEDSIAGREGLQLDDLVVRINNTPTAGLTHPQVHDLLISSGNDLKLAVKRGDVEQFIIDAINNNETQLLSELQTVTNREEESYKSHEEVSSSTSTTVKESLASEFITSHTILSTDDYKSFESGNMIIPKTTENIESHPTVSLDSFVEPGGRKWSTFLQRPKNPKPKSKNEQTIPKESQYKVIIKKQSKIKPSAKYSKQELQPETHSETAATPESMLDEVEVETSSLEIEIDYQTQIDEEISVEYESTIDNEHCAEEQHLEEPYTNEDKEEGEQPNEQCINLTIGNIVTENTPSLEEQLIAVQRQLQELANLPSAIQETLAQVTQKLATIVKIDHPEKDFVAFDESHAEEIVQELRYYYMEAADTDTEINLQLRDEECEIPYTELNEEIQETIVDETPSEDDLERLRKEEEKLVKQQKELHLPVEDRKTKSPPRPIQRPIILPGGRKWSAPGDACPKIRNPKMSDDRICDTIETFSEVLVGKTKGINFMKYQPPPKNMDYLQRSEVYRLVHDMEPPVKGISIRGGKILAEQDYYQKIDAA